MLKSFVILVISFISLIIAAQQQHDTAMLLIDIQEFYFDPGKSPLAGNVEASEKTAQLLAYFRGNDMPVIHVMHKGGGDIHENVSPLPGEKVFIKEEVSCFRGTGLNEYLETKGIHTLVIAGMMTHMCVEAAVRAAADLGYNCILIHDACATKDLEYGGEIVRAHDVQLSTLNTLRAYAKIQSTNDFLAKP